MKSAVRLQSTIKNYSSVGGSPSSGENEEYRFVSYRHKGLLHYHTIFFEIAIAWNQLTLIRIVMQKHDSFISFFSEICFPDTFFLKSIFFKWRQSYTIVHTCTGYCTDMTLRIKANYFTTILHFQQGGVIPQTNLLHIICFWSNIVNDRLHKLAK